MQSRRQRNAADNTANECEHPRRSGVPTFKQRLRRLVHRHDASSPPSFDIALCLLQDVLMEKVSGNRLTPQWGLVDEYNAVYSLIRQTVVAGEGNSLIVTGPRGTGKKTIVEQALRDVGQQYTEDFHVIRLNGFLHTDDKLALRDIWIQLGKDMSVANDALGKNHADSLSSLLALLSHATEAGQVAKSVIFIMEEFDLFASHPRQTLLYNLFDVAQSQAAPIAVIGLTTKIDVTESLEKRVKSRFSHRHINIEPPQAFVIFEQMCKTCISIPRAEDELHLQERDWLCETKVKSSKWNKSKSGPSDPSLIKAWNDLVEFVFKDAGFISNYLTPVYKTTKSVPTVMSMFTTIIASLPDHGLSAKSFHHYLDALVPAPDDSKLAILPHLSDLELALLIAATRLEIVRDSYTCNFRMAYAEYVSLASQARIQSAAGGAAAAGAATKVWDQHVALMEWYKLIERELLMPIATMGSSYEGDLKMYRADVALEEIVQAVPALDRTLARWCKQL